MMGILDEGTGMLEAKFLEHWHGALYHLTLRSISGCLSDR